MGLEISKRYSSYSFHLVSAKLYDDIGYHGGIQAITFLGNRPSLKASWHFETLTLESMGKANMWNISKMADHRAKQPKMWDSGSYSACRVLLSFVWGYSVQFAKFPILQFLKLCSSPNFHPIHQNFIQAIIQAITFWAICPKLNNYGI